MPLLFLHLLKDGLDFLAAGFGKKINGVGPLTASLDFDAVPKPARMVMVAGDLFPGDIFIGVAQPKEAPTFDDDFLGAEMNLLGDEPPTQYDRGKQGRFRREGLDHRDLLFSGEIVPAGRALFRGGFGKFRALGTFLADNSASAGRADLGRIWHFATAFGAGFHDGCAGRLLKRLARRFQKCANVNL